MPDVDSGPVLMPDDKIRFIDSQRPALDDGTYTVTVTHELEIGATKALDAKRPLTFVVAGPRFILAPGEVASVFPPPGSSGAFAAVLPHVLLDRPSLPWERSAIPAAHDDGPPWLALLVLAEDEIQRSATVRASELITAPAGAAAPAPSPSFPLLPRGPSDDPEQPVLVIDIAAALAAKILPTTGELTLLTGVRDVNGAEGRALVVASRLPARGKRNLVHLVSLEHQYRPAAKPGAQPGHWAKDVTTGTVRLISLAQWDFFCEGDDGDLGVILKEITIGGFRLNTAGLKGSLGPAQAGAVPVEHRLATGERTAAWYHGPLSIRDHGVALPLPARRAEELLLVEKATGMTDISYAAAWELGRVLALRDPAVGVRLYQWKRLVAHAGHATQWMESTPEEVGAPFCPVFALGDWFENALARLAAVPFNYLVPEPKLLPTETICLFTLDMKWIEALFDGAFSIGRTSARQKTADVALRKALPAIRSRSGMLLRSAAVAGWPDLLVDGFGKGNVRLSALRFERLAKDTLLVLFEGTLASVEVHPHPQALHFGFDGNAKAGFNKSGQAVAFRDRRERVIKIDTLGEALKATGSHDFAAKIIEGVPKVSYSILEIIHA